VIGGQSARDAKNAVLHRPRCRATSIPASAKSTAYLYSIDTCRWSTERLRPESAARGARGGGRALRRRLSAQCRADDHRAQRRRSIRRRARKMPAQSRPITPSSASDRMMTTDGQQILHYPDPAY
jgi:hypothetical protein